MPDSRNMYESREYTSNQTDYYAELAVKLIIPSLFVIAPQNRSPNCDKNGETFG
jgi:hypothetical protein